MLKTILNFIVVIGVILCISNIVLADYQTTRLSDDSGDSPQINDNGYVVWRGSDGHDSEIFLYNGSNTTQLTDNDNFDDTPQINNNNYVVWEGHDGNDFEIYLYDGSETTQLTDNGHDDQLPQINNNNHVVWKGYDGHDSEIFLHDNSSITQLTDNDNFDDTPQINDNGYVVWEGNDGNDFEIYLYDGSETSLFTDNGHDDQLPQINNNNYLVWVRHGGNDSEIFLHDDSETTQLTDNNHNDDTPQININNHVVWHSNISIFLATPIITPVEGGDGCFIATAAYGSYMEPHVMTLRQFRDSYLLTNKFGARFVEIYYRFSPPMANFIAQHDSLRSVVRIGLAPMVGFSWLVLNYGVMTTIFVFFSMLTLIIGGACFIVKTRKTN